MTALPPSEIRYSQSTISTVFDRRCRHSRKPIEHTLEEICEGRQTISSIPSITVCRHNDQWYTKDNRRLWVFKHLEALGKCTTISVNITERSNVPNKKFTTSNEGISVGFFDRYAPVPSGHWYREAEKLLSSINDRIRQSASKSGKDADSPVCELKTETSSKSDSSISSTQDSGVEINSDLESSNSNSNCQCIQKSQENTTITIGSPDNEDDSSLDPLDECNDNADPKDSLEGKMQSDDQRSDQVHQLDQCQKGDQDRCQNDQDFVRHTQKSIQDQILYQQLEVCQARDLQIQNEREIMDDGVRKGANSLKRTHVGVEEESDYPHAKNMCTEGDIK